MRKMRSMSIGWEGWVQDEKYEYRMRRISIQYKKDQYMMRKIRYYTGWEGSDILQDEKDQYRMRKIRYYTGWEGWEGSDILQDEKDQMFYRMRRISTIWEGWVQWELFEYRMRRISIQNVKNKFSYFNWSSWIMRGLFWSFKNEKDNWG